MDVIKFKTKFIFVVYDLDKDGDVHSISSFEDIVDAKEYIDILVTDCGFDIRNVKIARVPYRLY